MLDLFKPNMEKLKAKKNIKGLIRLLQNKKDYSMRSFAVEALGDIKDKRAVEPLIVILKNSDENIRERAVEALGRIGDLRGVEPLIEILKDEKCCVRISAVKALRNLGYKPLSNSEKIFYLIASQDWNEIAKIGETAIEPLINIMKDEAIRDRAAEALGKIGSARSVEPLITLLNDKNYMVRISAAEALGKIRDERAVEPLIQIMTDENYNVRMSAAKALSKIGDERALEYTITLLKDNKNYYNTAAEALEKFWNKRAIEHLIVLLKDTDNFVRLEASEVLGKIGDNRVMKPLIEVLMDKDHNVRKAAVKSLRKLNYKPSNNYERLVYLIEANKWNEIIKIGEPAVELLIEFLNDSVINIRKNAAEVLGKIGNIKAVEPLISILTDSNKDVRECAAVALGKIGDERAVQPLIFMEDDRKFINSIAIAAVGKIRRYSGEIILELLKDKDNDIRRIAAKTAKPYLGAKAIEPLIAVLEDTDKYVRFCAAESLEYLHWKPLNNSEKVIYLRAKQKWDEIISMGEIAIEPLINFLQNNDNDDQMNIVDALGRIGDARAVLPLIEVLQDKNYYYFIETTLEAIGKIGDTRAVEPLLEILKDSNGNIRKNVVETLVSVGDLRCVGPLIEVLKDSDISIRCNAAEALGKIGNINAVKPLTMLLNDKYYMVRVKAAEALGKIGNINAVKPLTMLLNDKYYMVRVKAAEALGNIGDAKSVEPLIPIMKDQDYSVRMSAANALEILGWKPSNISENIIYLIAKDSWNEIVNLGKNAVEFLVAILRSKDDYNHKIKKDIAVALGIIGDTRAVEPLINAISGYNGLEVAIALIKIGDKRSVETIIKFLIKKIPVYNNIGYQELYQEFTYFFGKYSSFILSAFSIEYINSYTDVCINQSENAVKQLTKIRTRISNNILNLVTTIKDYDIYKGTDDHGGRTAIIVNFDTVRKIALDELKRRGHPPYDPSVFLDEEEWKK
ncbi:MAG: HEAT repeat domain-containing protein [Candidatus Saelkia tenebricola]|nr:HEAT repeat domain-containing protein [Candidatus Saelkia tenebricola]